MSESSILENEQLEAVTGGTGTMDEAGIGGGVKGSAPCLPAAPPEAAKAE